MFDTKIGQDSCGERKGNSRQLLLQILISILKIIFFGFGNILKRIWYRFKLNKTYIFEYFQYIKTREGLRELKNIPRVFTKNENGRTEEIIDDF